MTPSRKILIGRLLSGCYLVAWKSVHGNKNYRVYDLSANPVATVGEKTFRTLDRYIDPKIKVWKKDRHGRITLNLSAVRQLHGRSTIKKMYKESKLK